MKMKTNRSAAIDDIAKIIDAYAAPLLREIENLQKRVEAGVATFAPVEPNEDMLAGMARFRAVIDELPRLSRSIIVSREVHGLTYPQMAEVYKIPVGTVMSRLHRARQQFRKIEAKHRRRAKRKAMFIARVASETM